jgi:hypothetical protein
MINWTGAIIIHQNHRLEARACLKTWLAGTIDRDIFESLAA